MEHNEQARRIGAWIEGSSRRRTNTRYKSPNCLFIMYHPCSRNYNLVFDAPTGLAVDGSRAATPILLFLVLFYFVFIVILFYLFYDGHIGIGGLPLHSRLRSHAIS